MIFPHVPPDVPWLAAFEPRAGEGKGGEGVGTPGSSPRAVVWVWGAEVAVARLPFGVVCAKGQVTLGKGDHEKRQHLQP